MVYYHTGPDTYTLIPPSVTDNFTVKVVVTDGNSTVQQIIQAPAVQPWYAISGYCTDGASGEPTGQHLFDQECAEHGIEHRLIKPKKPQTNGMAQRFNGRIKSYSADSL